LRGADVPLGARALLLERSGAFQRKSWRWCCEPMVYSAAISARDKPLLLNGSRLEKLHLRSIVTAAMGSRLARPCRRMEKEFEGSVTGVGSAETQCERDTGECVEAGGKERRSRMHLLPPDG
jgi:hypothetical protein